MSPTEPDKLSNAIYIPRARLTAFLVLVVLVLLTNHVMLQVSYYQWGAGHWVLRDLFDVDVEENIPTWYSSVSLLFCSALLYMIASRKSRKQDRFSAHWRFLSIGFLILSADECAGLHEALNTVADISWTIPGAISFGLVAACYFRFLGHLPKRTRIGFLLAGTLFAAGALGVEHATDWYLENYNMDSLGYNLLTPIEEGLEMLGVVLFINSLLGYLDGENEVVIPLRDTREEG